VQGTMLAEGKNEAEENLEKYKSTQFIKQGEEA
jgi:hypothetical protein